MNLHHMHLLGSFSQYRLIYRYHHDTYVYVVCFNNEKNYCRYKFSQLFHTYFNLFRPTVDSEVVEIE
jgi:hypothetical protein